jgi:hypothetical protein
MKRFVEGSDRSQSTLFPECLEDWIGEDNTVRAIDVFVDELSLGALGFGGVDPEATGRPSYHPSVLLKLYGFASATRRSLRNDRDGERWPARDVRSSRGPWRRRPGRVRGRVRGRCSRAPAQ